MATTSQNARANSSDASRTSHNLIVKAKAREPAAWERLAKLYSPLVYFWCQESGLPQADLHDVFQDVFYALARDIDKFHHIESGSFRGWLRTITRNKVIDHFRRSGLEPIAFGGTDALNLFDQIPAAAQKLSTENSPDRARGRFAQNESEIHQSMLCEALSNVRSCFSEQTWMAFWMVVIDGREAKDVAHELNMRPGTVRVAKSRVLKRLRLEIGDAIE
jgi:RNA polymerase sigma-70 factor, ECF subfamily